MAKDLRSFIAENEWLFLWVPKLSLQHPGGRARFGRTLPPGFDDIELEDFL